MSAQAAIFRVGADSLCTHASIQSALDAAQDNPGPDTIRISSSLIYRDQRLFIGGHEVTLEGAYARCQSTSPGLVRTRISGAGGVRDSVFRIENATATLVGLSIVGGDSNDRGGGIAIAGTTPTRVTLRNTQVRDNSALDGGGISVIGETSQLVLDSESVVEFNTARRNGGGHSDHPL